MKHTWERGLYNDDNERMIMICCCDSVSAVWRPRAPLRDCCVTSHLQKV